MNVPPPRYSKLLAAASLFLATTSTGLAVQFQVPDYGPPTRNAGVPTDVAIRFLDRATFGATTADIRFVTRFGREAWIDAQFAMPPTLFLQDMIDFRCGPDQPGQDSNTCPNYFAPAHTFFLAQEWFNHALYAPDQLRQRVAFALSEIFVVSDLDGVVQESPSTLADYYDTLVRGATTDYRSLIEEVTLHPIMGAYLTMAGNRKRDPILDTRPDENYAREIMQLFSIGLHELRPNGTVRLGTDGLPIPTYTQDTITETARALTGWSFNGLAPTGILADFLALFPRVGEMLPWASFHDVDAKFIVDGGVLPAGGSARQDLGGFLDVLSAHDNVGPFIGKQLIQRLVTSNPSAAYVQRISIVWEDDGFGVRGNLQAVVKAILLDREAFQGHVALPTTFGKLREPILKLTGIWRKFGSRGNVTLTPFQGGTAFGQRAMGSPSVFNFFRPDYASSSLAAAGLVAPELEIATHSLVTRTSNLLTTTIMEGNSDVADFSHPEPVFDLGPLKRFAGDPAKLVDYLDLILNGGLTSAATKTILTNYLATLPMQVPGLPAGYVRATEGLAIMAASPDYALQK